MGHAHVVIVHHHGQHISRCAVAPKQDHVVELIVGEAHIALHLVVHDGLARLLRPQTDDKRRTGGRLCRIAVAPAPVITDGLALGPLLGAHLVQFGGSRVAAIGLALRQQLFGHLAVTACARGLINGLPVPV